VNLCVLLYDVGEFDGVIGNYCCVFDFFMWVEDMIF